MKVGGVDLHIMDMISSPPNLIKKIQSFTRQKGKEKEDALFGNSHIYTCINLEFSFNSDIESTELFFFLLFSYRRAEGEIH